MRDTQAPVMHDNAPADARPADYLREILAVVADNLPLELTVTRLLELAVAACQAGGGRVLLFVEPRLSVSSGAGKTWSVSDDRLAQAVGGLLPGMSPEPVSFGRGGRRAHTAMIAPVVVDGLMAGGLVLLFRGEVAGVAATVMDDVVNGLRICVSRARAERRLERQPLLERAFDAFEEPALVLDDARRVVTMNAAAETAFGVARARAEGQYAADLPGAAPLAEALKSGAMPDEWTREGSDRVYAPRLTRIKADPDKRSLWVLTDLTRTKQLEHNHDEFIRVVSHDLRSPLAAILMYVSLLESQLEEANDAAKLRMLRKIEQGLVTLNGYVDNIQDAGGYDPETGFYQMNRQPVDLCELAERVAANVLIAPQKDLTLTVVGDADAPTVNVDCVMMERAILNLVDNAVKYTPDGGSIELLVEHDATHVRVGVRDTGLGISEEDQKRLFKRHVRLRRSEHRTIKGTGLGLFIVRSVARRHGGDAWVESREGTGSTFWFSIPLVGENVLVPQPQA